MLFKNVFQRRIGNDINRAVDGAAMRVEFLDANPEVFASATRSGADLDSFLDQPCTWFEMLLALSVHLDFTYDEGIQNHFTGIIGNLGLDRLLDPRVRPYDEIDQDMVDSSCNRVDFNLFAPDGHGGLFPLNNSDHLDQRRIEIWDQAGAYFREKLEGVMWTSTT